MTKVAKFLSREERGAPTPNLEICFTARTWNTTDSYLIHTLMHRLAVLQTFDERHISNLAYEYAPFEYGSTSLGCIALHWNR
jgi:hypothetical protein